MDSLPFKAKAGGGITPPCVRQYGISTEAQGETSAYMPRNDLGILKNPQNDILHISVFVSVNKN